MSRFYFNYFFSKDKDKSKNIIYVSFKNAEIF